MRAIFVIVLAIVVGGLAGYFVGDYFAKDAPYSYEYEKQAIAERKQLFEDNSQTPEVKNEAKTVSGPKAVVDQYIFNFGVFQKDQKGSHDFIVRNEGTENLTLAFVEKSCSCTDVNVSRSSVAPGKEAVVTVKWKPNLASGSYSQGVLLKTNDPNDSQLYLKVTGVYSAPIIIAPNPVSLNAFASREATSKIRVFLFEPIPWRFSAAIVTILNIFRLNSRNRN